MDTLSVVSADLLIRHSKLLVVFESSVETRSDLSAPHRANSLLFGAIKRKGLLVAGIIKTMWPATVWSHKGICHGSR